MVFSGLWARTFTDQDGRFEMLAPFEKSETEGAGYDVHLRAESPGFVDLRGGDWYSELDQGPDGFELYLARRGPHRIRIQFQNPQAAGGPVNLVLGYEPDSRQDWDARTYIVAKVDPYVDTWFDTPEAFRDSMNDTEFRLVSASAPNVLMDPSSYAPTSNSREETVYSIRLLVEDTVSVSGTVTDMETGEPVPHARLSGPGWTEFAVADAEGRFELVISRQPRGVRGEVLSADHWFFTIADEAYAEMRALVTETTIVQNQTGSLSLGPGGTLAGPWTIQLRRWVSAEVDCRDLPPESWSEQNLSSTYEISGAFAVDRGPWKIDSNGLCRIERLPWGLSEFRLSAGPSTSSARVLPVAVGGWTGNPPYHLRLQD